MNKKLIISIVVASIFLSNIAFAEELKETLELYLQDDTLDFLGKNYDKIIFKDNLSFVDDVKTIPLQLRSLHKILTQEENIYAYGSLGGLVGLKVSLGARRFGLLMAKVIKLIH